MELFLQAAVLAIITVVLTAMLKKTNQELALLLSLAACVLLGVFLMHLAEPVVEFLTKLRDLAGLDKSLMTPMLKTIGIGLLTQLSATICADAGENAIAKLVEVCGGVLALYVALPLMEAVIDMVEQMSGG